MIIDQQQTRRVLDIATTMMARRHAVPRLFYKKFSSTISPRERAIFERAVIDRIGEIIEPVSQQCLNAIGAIRNVKVGNDHTVDVELDFFISGYPHQKKLIDKCHETLKMLPWMQSSKIQVMEQPYAASHLSASKSLESVKHVIGVSSCKGGVGKSTVAVNIAFALAKKGLKVGILDADVYGPSLPYMVSPDNGDTGVYRAGPESAQCLPLKRGNVSFLSFGHVNPRAGVPGAGGKTAAVVRGPIVSRVINQLVAGTVWGELDYLVVDMPPGTGDIQITLTQSIAFTGAVIVTTPHALAVADVLKGVEMFRDLRVPTLAVANNMAYFKCDHGQVYHPFGDISTSYLQKEIRRSGMFSAEERDVSVVSFPLTQAMSQLGSSLSAASDKDKLHEGIPLVEREPNSLAARTFDELADATLEQIFLRQLSAQMLPQVSYKENTKEIVLRYFTPNQAVEYRIPAIELRVRDPLTGDVVQSDDSTRSKDKYSLAYPVKIDLKGNYGVSFVWSDGHYADIFHFDALKKISKECVTNASNLDSIS